MAFTFGKLTNGRTSKSLSSSSECKLTTSSLYYSYSLITSALSNHLTTWKYYDEVLKMLVFIKRAPADPLQVAVYKYWRTPLLASFRWKMHTLTSLSKDRRCAFSICFICTFYATLGF